MKFNSIQRLKCQKPTDKFQNWTQVVKESINLALFNYLRDLGGVHKHSELTCSELSDRTFQASNLSSGTVQQIFNPVTHRVWIFRNNYVREGQELSAMMGMMLYNSID